MTETQARARLQKLLAITQDRGAATGEQANATRAIGAILQEHPNLRDMITGTGETASRPEDTDARGGSPTFWQGVLVGVGTTVAMLGVLVLGSLFNRGNDTR
ncbi:MAG: hypothetical protein FJZ47_01420 [Candidatus Tectomicrobia bacterium]|uniref:Uncharacterized protein n=1 Tax=Tectimicrobiota bacterium TaxID=2528274 RepID=A0A937VWZ5_UNCTE|nr:hypothetical protein [Candidatus Tectomicrobia bacterium]